jgi:hypothetical protein
MFPRKRLNYNNERCFLCGPSQRIINGTNLKFSELWDIRQLVRTLAEDIVKIRYQETTSEAINDFVCVCVQLQ